MGRRVKRLGMHGSHVEATLNAVPNVFLAAVACCKGAMVLSD